MSSANYLILHGRVEEVAFTWLITFCTYPSTKIVSDPLSVPREFVCLEGSIFAALACAISGSALGEMLDIAPSTVPLKSLKMLAVITNT